MLFFFVVITLCLLIMVALKLFRYHLSRGEHGVTFLSLYIKGIVPNILIIHTLIIKLTGVGKKLPAFQADEKIN